MTDSPDSEPEANSPGSTSPADARATPSLDGTFQSLVENAADLIAIVDRSHRVVFINHSDLADGCLASDDAVFEKIVAFEDREETRRAIDRVFETGQNISYEFKVPGEGEPLHFSTRLSPVLRGQSIHQITVIATDITGQRKAEEEREQLEMQLQQAQKMEAIGRLTGGVAHDFNNLLTVILGNLELAKSRPELSDPIKALINNAMAAGTRAGSLTQRLLAFSRRQALRPEILNLHELVLGMEELLRRTLGETIEVEVISRGRSGDCEADPAQIENAVLNLAINARDAMPKGGRLTLETANVTLDAEHAAQHEEVEPGRYVMLSVRDNGSGMSREVASRAFDPFFTTKETGRGSGLGLSMVYGFVKQSGGAVSIQSKEAEGTTLELYFPCISSQESQASRGPRGEHEPRGRGEIILVVEDDPSVRSLTVRLLRHFGYQTLEAQSGGDALDHLRSRDDIALLLTDLVLGAGYSGREVAGEAKTTVPGLRVLFMSGYRENVVDNEERLNPGVPLLEKPFSKAALARAVRAALDG